MNKLKAAMPIIITAVAALFIYLPYTAYRGCDRTAIPYLIPSLIPLTRIAAALLLIAGWVAYAVIKKHVGGKYKWVMGALLVLASLVLLISAWGLAFNPNWCNLSI